MRHLRPASSSRPLAGHWFTLCALPDKDMQEAAELVRGTGGRAFSAQTARLVTDPLCAHAICPEGIPLNLLNFFRTKADFKLGARCIAILTRSGHAWLRRTCVPPSQHTATNPILQTLHIP